MFDFEQIVQKRRSIRRFLPLAIPHDLLADSLSLAQRAPSNSNIQPWQLFFAEGHDKDHVRGALLREVRVNPRETAPLPRAFQARRSALGTLVYGAMGIAREDSVGRATAVLRNYEFFGAPMVGILCMHRDLGLVDAVGVGMYLQTLILGLTARGIGTCVQASLATYPEVLRRELCIPEELTILCGLALGYADPDFPANHIETPRQPVAENVVFHDVDRE